MFNKENKSLKQANALVKKINELEPKFETMNNVELKEMTHLFKERIAKGETLDSILPEAFATVREASKRVLNMRHYDVQLIGGITLHQGKIAEMRTGEGKTLVATLPAYLNALTGKGVHVITVNDYLAARDKEIMENLYGFLGLTTGVILSGQSPAVKKKEYACDIVYGTNNEFGFDYLRDNMVQNKDHKVQGELNFCIVDEVDSILIDEARTPLIISAPSKDANSLYIAADQFVKTLSNDDYTIDEKLNSISLTDEGISKAEKFFGIEELMDIKNALKQHHINQALRANYRMKKEVDYIVKKGEVLIVDEFTGRIMEGRRYSDGLHQAIEAKEGVKIQKESQTLATITFQNYFRLYNKLSGMTGTAKTEEEEFKSIYKLDVVTIPTNKPVIREDHADKIYMNKHYKISAVVNEIKERHSKNQPLLVGTISIEDSELLSKKLKEANIPHNVLNAKHHEQEAYIIAQAGRLGAVTISTNMAGRGTDILIGGNAELLAKEEVRKALNCSHEELEVIYTQSSEELSERENEIIEFYNKSLSKYKEQVDKEYNEVIAAGGLCVIGTERHESRRIDNQLRGRAGRQGDKGESIFFLSLQDDLMRIFGGEKIQVVAEKLGASDTAIDNKFITKNIENAQKKIESSHFSTRKQVVKYDDVLNEQRIKIYTYRNLILSEYDISTSIFKMMDEVAQDIYNQILETKKSFKKWNTEELETFTNNILNLPEPLGYANLSKLTPQTFKEHIKHTLMNEYTKKEEILGKEAILNICRNRILNEVDTKWMDHIDSLSNLKEGIHLRSLGQEDPAVAYRIEGSNMFDSMTLEIAYDIVKGLFEI